MQFFRNLRRAGVAPALFASSVLLLNGCEKPPAPPPQGPMPVQVTTAVQKDVPQVGDWVATTDGYVNAQIQPQVSGYLIRQDYKEGSVVHKDQVLFEIDDRPFQATLDQTKGALAQAQAQVELAAINVKRDTPLAAAHAIAQSTLDNDVQTLAADQAAVASQQANVRAAELNVGFTKVRSLIDGVAGQAQMQVGNLVNSTSVLTSVSQLNPIKVYFSISEQEYLTLSERAKSGGRTDLLNSGNLIPLKLTLANNQVFPATGHIIFVDRSVSAQTGSIRLAAGFANPGNLLRPGQFGRIKAEVGVLHNAVLIPQKAVNELQGNYLVAVVKGDKVKIHPVKQGAQVGNDVVITEGINAGDTVIVEGIDKLKDGMPVAPQPAQENSAAPAGAKSPAGQPGSQGK